MYNDERNKTLSELRKQTLFRRFAFILLFVILAGSLAGVGSLLFSNSSITDEAGRGEAEVEVAAITGSGTSASPWIITTKADLQAWAGSSTYWGANTYTQLAADIDWGGSAGGNYPRVTGFAGNFDGKNHVVKNIYMSYSSATIGFFSTVGNGAIIRNFGLVGGSLTLIAGSTGNGGIIGTVNASSTVLIEDCFNGADVTTTNGTSHSHDTAGIVGFCANSGVNLTIRRVFNIGTIKSSHYLGGIIGRGGATMEDVFNSGSIIAILATNNHAIGGIIGYHGSFGSTLKNVYNAGTVDGRIATSDGRIGGLIGLGSSTKLDNSYNCGYVYGWSASQSDIVGTSYTGLTSSLGLFNNSDKISKNGAGTNRTTAQMTNDNVLSTTTVNGGMSELGVNWYKRPNEGTNNNQMFYPELKVFAEHPWKALQAYSKASVRVSGYADPGYNPIKNDAPTCTANTAVNDVPWIGNGTK